MKAVSRGYSEISEAIHLLQVFGGSDLTEMLAKIEVSL
jgi:hypothetical protein